ncbi:MAG: hypothetical protein SOW59_06515 [Corynebacterium sp.]|nr:hypothetical protein [Corynebacterium sp.]
MKKSRILAAATSLALATSLAAAPAHAEIQTNPGFVPGEKGSTATGSSMLDTAGITVGVALLVKLVVDNVTPLRQAIDAAAAQAGIQTSSALDLSVEKFLRSIGQVEVADQIAALSS